MKQKPAPAGVWVVTPGHHSARFPAAHGCGADVALVDLEDSVPAAVKPQARQDAAAFFTVPTAADCALETPRALEELPSIMRAERIAGVVFGTADYATAVGCSKGWEAMLHARSALVTSAAAAGICAIDSPFFDLDDLDGLRGTPSWPLPRRRAAASSASTGR